MVAGMSLMPEYFESHAEMVILLAPIVSLYHTSNTVLLQLVPRMYTIKWWLDFFDMYDIFPRKTLESTSTGFCDTFPDLCAEMKSYLK